MAPRVFGRKFCALWLSLIEVHPHIMSATFFIFNRSVVRYQAVLRAFHIRISGKDISLLTSTQPKHAAAQTTETEIDLTPNA